MVSFASFHMEDGQPIYLQIVSHVKRMVAAGTAADQEELPSRRVLSATLGVNPNTVQKAYRILEEEGLMESRTGAKSVLTLDEEKVAAIRRQLVEGEAASLVALLKGTGFSREETQSLVARLWDTAAEKGGQT